MQRILSPGWLIVFVAAPLLGATVATLAWSKSPAEPRATGGGVMELTQRDFGTYVLNSPVPVLVDFHAHWCEPCQRQSPILEQAARELDNARIVKVNVDENRELAAAYGIRSIPALLVFEQGKLVDRYVGLASKQQIKSLLNRGSAE
jgi:thioredoxin 1